MDAWRPLQASHRLQGPISLRRNWNHRFLTLEPKCHSDWRRTCGMVLLKKLASSMQLSAVSREHLEESQATGSQPREGDWSLVEGSNMLLAEMYANEVWVGLECIQVFEGFRFVSDSTIKSMIPSSGWALLLSVVAYSLLFFLQGKIERFCKDNITGGTCSMLHSHAPCKFWSRRYGAVPVAVAGVPINDKILCESFLVWPPQPE